MLMYYSLIEGKSSHLVGENFFSKTFQAIGEQWNQTHVCR